MDAALRRLHRRQAGSRLVVLSGDPAFEALPAYFDEHLEPALQGLLAAAVAIGEVRADARPHDLLRAVACLCRAGSDDDQARARLLVSLLVDGLRYRAVRSG